MRCDLAQGFYFSKPLAGEAAGALVATNPSWRVTG
jgi:EAL domain-containing protein (putative c-di-GMP-specific phosphodiesterase class I)